MSYVGIINFFICPPAEYVCNVASVELGVMDIPNNMLEIFEKWYASFSGRDRKFTMIGAAISGHFQRQ